MGLFDPSSASGASSGAGGGPAVPPPPQATNAPTGTRPKVKKQTPSFLGADSSPDVTQRSDKTLLGQ